MGLDRPAGDNRRLAISGFDNPWPRAARRSAWVSVSAAQPTAGRRLAARGPRRMPWGRSRPWSRRRSVRAPIAAYRSAAPEDAAGPLQVPLLASTTASSSAAVSASSGARWASKSLYAVRSRSGRRRSCPGTGQRPRLGTWARTAVPGISTAAAPARSASSRSPAARAERTSLDTHPHRPQRRAGSTCPPGRAIRVSSAVAAARSPAVSARQARAHINGRAAIRAATPLP